MKYKILLALLVINVNSFANDIGVKVSKFLDSIVCEENQDQDAIGEHGERSIYGITYSVWKQHMTGLSFSLCTNDKNLAKVCAIRHLNWLSMQLNLHGYPSNVYTLATCWNRGLNGYLYYARNGKVSNYGLDVKEMYSY